MLDALQGYDWSEVFKYASNPEHAWGVPQHGFDREDVVTVVYLVEGSNDDLPWVIIALLKDGRYGYVTAWCDYTGWG